MRTSYAKTYDVSVNVPRRLSRVNQSFPGYVSVALAVALSALPSSTLAQTWYYSSTTIEGTTPTERQLYRGLRQSSEFQQKIQALPSVADAAISIPILFGVGVNNISSNFGDPRDGGARLHEGEDMMAVKGTPIVSPTPAVVIRTGVGSGQGIYVTTANPGGENFVYMHLDKLGEGVAPGTVLAQGSLIGYVGNTGNASGGAAHLHFEIHNSTGTPIDPFPRLTSEFNAAQKMTYLSQIFGISSDPVALAQFLVTNFRNTFVSAAQSGVVLPPLITGALGSVPAASPTSDTLPAGDLMLGSSGAAVVELQTFLVAKSTGAQAERLAGAGATGYFGPMTQSALVEYQTAVGISPADGYYGAATRAAVAADTGTQPPIANPPVIGSTTFTRNLFLGVNGEDVRVLQKLLNARGYTVAVSGAGSAGYETSYFGPATKAAVIRFQVAHSIEPAVGYFGPISQAALASL
ncbi:MAG: peptidase M23 [Parcubacteria group bacterium Athens0416_74]|nr:MAG: peptidase M23 [Parcubacteria group bacterium Athens0416_74]